MKTYKDMVEEVNGTVSAREKLKKAKKGDTMSFTHHKHGEVSGEYHGVKRMGPHSYASVDVKGKGKFYVPLHQVTHHPKPKVNEQADQDLDEAARSTELKVGHKVSFSHPDHGTVQGKIYHTDGQHASIEVKHTKHFGSRYKVAHDKLTRVPTSKAK